MVKYLRLKNLSSSEKHQIAWGTGELGKFYLNIESLNNTKIPKSLYYARIAVDYYGMAVRDNTFKQLVYLGKQIDKGINED